MEIDPAAFLRFILLAGIAVQQLHARPTVVLTLLGNDKFGLKFEKPTYKFSVQEQEPAGTEVGSVSALTGSSFIIVTYLLRDHADKFSITNQGNIVTRIMLDREKQDLYSITVEAVDSQTPSSTAVTLVTIHVGDINDNPPVFPDLVQTELTCLEEQKPIDFGLFAATDKDTGNNSVITYSLENDFNGTFHIDSSTGRLTTTRHLDREMVDSYHINITAADCGRPQLFSNLVVHIAVGDINDNPPVFEKNSFNISLKENVPPHVILNVTATDKDIGCNAVIRYYIVGASPLFYIGERSGQIMTLQPLDFEKASQYTVVVKAFNPGDPRLQDNSTITVYVEDVNEDRPAFQSNCYFKILLDNATAGLLVVDVNAAVKNRSFDDGVFYSITGGNAENLFTISNSTGKITLTKELKKLNSTVCYPLIVTATVSGLPPLSTSVKVIVTAVPSNISTPVFTEEVYQPEPLRLSASPGTFVTQVWAQYGSTLTYSIGSGNEKDYFGIDQFNGTIKTKKYLKEEDFPITFTVQATDSADPKKYTEAIVNVTVVNENNFSPVFTQPLVKTVLKEGEPVARKIVQLKALDDDTGRNGALTYGILKGDQGKFRINATTGILCTNAVFDYEQDPTEYQIVVYAEDDGVPVKKKGYCTVIVQISDINDCVPVFLPLPPIVVKENAPVGTIIGKVTATDKDSGDNAYVQYNMTGDDNPFEIDGAHGILRIKHPLDYEKKQEPVLTVIASNNKSTKPLQSNVTVTVKLSDVNDNAPEFNNRVYFADVNIITPVVIHVVQVAATDRDEGHNALVKYDLLPGLPSSQFFLIKNVNEGNITTTGNLPAAGEIHLTVLAKDKGYPPLNKTALVIVRVLDNQPLLPEFNQTELSTTVMENTGDNHLVHTFAVTGPCCENVSYRIIAGNELGHFKLDEKSGLLRTAINLNYEQTHRYVITVQVKDSHTNSSHSSGPFSRNTARLTVLVKDVNEQPEFLQGSYSTIILNTVPYKFPVVKVEAKDPDFGANGLLSYILVDQPGNEFAIDEHTGQVYVVSVAEKVGTFSFKALATDRAGKGLASQTKVDVMIEPSTSDRTTSFTINQPINAVEQKMSEIKRIFEDKLHLDIYIVDMLSKIAGKSAKQSTATTVIRMIGIGQSNQTVPGHEMKRMFSKMSKDVKTELNKVFEEPVDVILEEVPTASMPPERIATITLSVLLGCMATGVIAFIAFTKKRNRTGEVLTEKPAVLTASLKKKYTQDGSSNGGPGDSMGGQRDIEPHADIDVQTKMAADSVKEVVPERDIEPHVDTDAQTMMAADKGKEVVPERNQNMPGERDNIQMHRKDPSHHYLELERHGTHGDDH